MRFGKADLQRRLLRKAVFRGTAKLLESVIKNTDEDKIPHVQDLIDELKRRGKLSPCLRRGIVERAEYERCKENDER